MPDDWPASFAVLSSELHFAHNMQNYAICASFTTYAIYTIYAIYATYTKLRNKEK